MKTIASRCEESSVTIHPDSHDRIAPIVRGVENHNLSSSSIIELGVREAQAQKKANSGDACVESGKGSISSSSSKRMIWQKAVSSRYLPNVSTRTRGLNFPSLVHTNTFF
jgi:hypothetical protein